MPRTVIGIVGGIASGKSTVAAAFAGLRPATVVDADKIARRVLERPDVAREVARRVLGAKGKGNQMSREKLAHHVFTNPRALAVLEEITHPRIRRAVVSAIRRARTPLVLLDAALLQETGGDELCDAVVYVACPARTRRARAVRNRGWTAAEHRRREARQWSCRRKRAHADFVVDNSGDPVRTRRDVRQVLRRIDRRG